MTYYYIDLFAGAGGLSEGFQKNGFVPVAHVEADCHACNTIRTRTAYHYLKKNNLQTYFDYITGRTDRESLYGRIPDLFMNTVINETISDETLKGIFARIRNNMEAFGVFGIDVVVGGPPCQPFSLMYRNRKTAGFYKDPRINLYRYYCKFLKEFTPKFIVFENVPGMQSAGTNREIFSNICTAIEDCGYTIEYRILNSKDFGVLQNRRRMILIGARDPLFKYPEFEETPNIFPLKDILSDLPPLEPGQTGDQKGYIGPITEALAKTGIRTEKDVLIQHMTRPHNVHDRKIYKMAIDMLQEKNRRFRYTDVPEEMVTMKNRTSFLDRFKVVDPNFPFSHTLVAHISKDGHYYIHPDSKQCRSLSVREAARIQSFEDNYYFEGPRTAIFRQIGNAVPPLMAATIAQKIKEMLDDCQD